MELLTERYIEKISGTLSCYDRIVVTGTLPVLSNANHLTAYMYQNNIRIFAKFAEPYRDELKLRVTVFFLPGVIYALIVVLGA